MARGPGWPEFGRSESSIFDVAIPITVTEERAMRLRSWPDALSIWPISCLVLISALFLTRTAVGDDIRFPEPVRLASGDSIASPDDPSCGESSCCESGCCEQSMCCYDCQSPYWSVEAGAVFLRRDHQTNVPLTNGVTPISVGDLAFNEYQGGPAVTLIRHNLMGSRTSFEVTYFGVRDTNSVTATGATAFFSNPQINFPNRNVGLDYRSSLDNTEINFRDTFGDWFTLLGGFRWVELSDELSTNFGGGATYRINVNNHLYGGQIGADILIWGSDRFSIEWIGKAGIYGNAADQDTTIVGVAGAVPNLSARDGQASFIGEMDLTARYSLNCRWNIIGGYKVMWLSGIALAPNQLATSNIVTGVATLDNNSQPIYHGFTVAAECVW
jgi:hypothetical protein